MIKFAAILVALTLAGCATESPDTPESSYVNSIASDSACIKSGLYISHTIINTIDGVKAGGRFDSIFCFTPGKHRLNISRFSATGDIDFEFLPYKKYMFQPKLHGISIVFELFEISVDPPVKVAQFKIKMASDSNHGLAPLYMLVPMNIK